VSTRESNKQIHAYVDAHASGVGDGLRDLVGELELVANVVHRSIDLVHVAGNSREILSA